MPFRVQTRSKSHKRRVVSALAYFLRATFNTADQGYANAQVLDTTAEGVQDGSFTVVEADGTLALASNKCAFTAQGTPAWGDQGLYSTTAITRALGTALLGIVNIASGDANDFGFNTAAALGRRSHFAYTTANRIWITVESSANYWRDSATHIDSTDHHLAIVLGGYDVNGIPWRSGQTVTDYVYGTAFFIKGGNYTTWTLLVRDPADNNTPLYLSTRFYDVAGTIDNVRVPNRDLSAVLQPTCLSTFTAANGTSLDAITPEAGGTWTEQVGDWDIQSNRADGPGASAQATVDPSIANAIIHVTANAAGAALFGITARYSDATHHWVIGGDDNDNEFQIWENDAGWTKRASTAIAVAQSTDYDITAILDDQDITGYLDRANRITYGSAALNETKTEHGLYSGNAGDRFDNFAIMARTSSVYEAKFNAV